MLKRKICGVRAFNMVDTRDAATAAAK